MYVRMCICKYIVLYSYMYTPGVESNRVKPPRSEQGSRA